MGPGSTSVIQVTNVAPMVTNEQLRTLFTHVGTIREFIVYPTHDPSQQIARICYVRFIDPMSVSVAQHLTNTVFIDRAILVKPVSDGKIPDESMALKLANEGHSQNSSNSGVVSQIETVNGVQSITTIDPRLNALGLPQYPPLSPSLDPSKIEEIRRTITVSNVNKKTTPEELLEFFNQFGEVKYLRMTTDEHDVIKSAMIEYTDQSSVANALQNTGITFHGSQLNIAHSTTSILKPQYKINVDPEKIYNLRELKRRSRSRSYRRRRSRTPRSRERKRSLSGSRSPRRRRSRSRDRNRSPYRRRSRDRSYSRERRSRRDRSRERDRRRSSRDRSVERKRSYERERERDRDRERKRRDRSREKDYERSRDRSKERTRKRDRSHSRDSDRKEKHRSRHKDSDRHRSRSPSSESKNIKLIKTPLIIDERKNKDSTLEIDNEIGTHDNMEMDIGSNNEMHNNGHSKLESASLKSEEHSSSQKSSSPNVATLGTSSSSSKHHHHRSSRHKHKHNKKSSRDYDSDDDKY